MSDYKIDPATGLYEVPEGYFWRVTKNSAGPIVQLRKKRRIGSFQVGHSYVFPSKEGAVRGILRGCDRVLRESDLHGELGSFSGDYPPNRV